ncbi:DUF4179 domain-containing protein [Olsenella sp. DSM 107455]|uniref:DUF4179 domain-containing protein n=1 Tax=Thermophilibacter gallinarum TaxID=2779357 RepID=A0ABR9QSP9_9ACTN|nr:DUF4179 domain-containing protein [Thermophilibacter gallinarum]MBE5024103.1 DUF4179 domain-containing protein [Thermophilibacter gallinarum]
MTSPLDSYTRSMDGLHFSDEAKARMAEGLRAAAAAKGAEKNVQPKAPAEVLIMSERRPGRRHTRRWARVAAGLAIALVLGGGTTVAAAAGVLPNPADVLSDVFGGAPAQTELLNEVGRPIGASATSNGVTVTAEAVVGDRSNYTVVYDVEFDDPSVLEDIEPGEDGTLPLVADATCYIDGVNGGGGGARFYDADPGDGTIQYAETMGFSTWNDAGIIGRTMRFWMSEIRAYDAEGGYETLATGDWHLKFEMNYVDTTVDLPAGQKTTWQGADVTIDAVAVSSVGVTVDYTIDRQIDDLGPSGQLSDEAEAKMEAVTGLPVTVTFADGTTFDATNANTHAQEQNDGTSAVTKTVTYDRIIAAGDIVSVTVGDVEIPVSAA